MKKHLGPLAGIACATACLLVLAGTARLSGQDLERVGPIPAASPARTEAKSALPAARTETSDTAGVASSDYLIGPEDVLEITVFDLKDLDTKVRVANDGTITLPLLGRVEASGAPRLSGRRG
jgi:polysaccharide export outer membrane protein